MAALVGGGSAERALAEGAKRFRALPITELTEADLQTNTDAAVLHDGLEGAPARQLHLLRRRRHL